MISTNLIMSLNNLQNEWKQWHSLYLSIYQILHTLEHCRLLPSTSLTNQWMHISIQTAESRELPGVAQKTRLWALIKEVHLFCAYQGFQLTVNKHLTIWIGYSSQRWGIENIGQNAWRHWCKGKSTDDTMRCNLQQIHWPVKEWVINTNVISKQIIVEEMNKCVQCFLYTGCLGLEDYMDSICTCWG